MSKQKMQAARDLIQQKKYDEARAILRTVRHPLAEEWLERLERISPETKSKRGRTAVSATAAPPRRSTSLLRVLLLLLVLIGVIGAAALLLLPGARSGSGGLGGLTSLVGGGGGGTSAGDYAFTSYFPENTIAYATMRTDDRYIAALDGILAKITSKLPEGMIQPGVPVSLSALLDQAAATINVAISGTAGDNGNPALDATDVAADTTTFENSIRTWLGDRAAGGIIPGGEGVTNGLGLVEVTNRANAIAFIEPLLPAENYTRTEESGFTVYTIGESAPIYLIVGDSLLAISDNKALLPLNGTPSNALGTQPAFTGAVGALPAGGYTILLYADFAEAFTFVNNTDDEQVATFTNAVETLAIGATILDERSLVIDAFVKRGDLSALEDMGITLSGTGAVDPAFLNNLPANTILATQGTDLKTVYDVLLANLRNLAEQGLLGEADSAAVDEAVAQIDQTLQSMAGGLRLQEDVLSWLTGDYVAFVTYDPLAPDVLGLTGTLFAEDVSTIPPLPVGFGVLIEATDPAKAQNLVDKLAVPLEQFGTMQGLQVRREIISDSNAVLLTLPDPTTSNRVVEIVLLANQRFLALGTRPAVEAAINGGGLTSAPRFTAAGRYTLPNPTSLWFADTNALTLGVDLQAETGSFNFSLMSLGLASDIDNFDVNDISPIQVQRAREVFRPLAAVFESATISTSTTNAGDALARAVLLLAP
jgi:hypothetical protein